jgi:hypothetical protein
MARLYFLGNYWKLNNLLILNTLNELFKLFPLETPFVYIKWQ